MNRFAQELKKYRDTQHLTIQKFAKKIGCSSATTFYYETGKRCPPFKKMLAILKKLGISPNILIFPTPSLPDSIPIPAIESTQPVESKKE